jgi:hypothetical protein
MERAKVSLVVDPALTRNTQFGTREWRLGQLVVRGAASCATWRLCLTQDGAPRNSVAANLSFMSRFGQSDSTKVLWQRRNQIFAQSS